MAQAVVPIISAVAGGMASKGGGETPGHDSGMGGDMGGLLKTGPNAGVIGSMLGQPGNTTQGTGDNSGGAAGSLMKALSNPQPNSPTPAPVQTQVDDMGRQIQNFQPMSTNDALRKNYGASLFDK